MKFLEVRLFLNLNINNNNFCITFDLSVAYPFYNILELKDYFNEIYVLFLQFFKNDK